MVLSVLWFLLSYIFADKMTIKEDIEYIVRDIWRAGMYCGECSVKDDEDETHDHSKYHSDFEDELLTLIKQVVEEALPEKDDDRPEITEWLISKDYTKGKNDAIDEMRKKLTKLLK